MRRWLLGYTGWFLLALLAWGAFLIGYWPAGAALALGERQGWLPPRPTGRGRPARFGPAPWNNPPGNTMRRSG